MDRIEILRQGISLEDEVLEIGPYFNPIAPRARGYRATTLDLYPTATLRERAAADPNSPKERLALIEEVDLVGSACSVADLACAKYGADRRFDWILSSHNIEHIPNPIRFLRQCSAVLRPEGRLRLAVPDKRTCFDHFRMLTDTGDWLEAFVEQRSMPTPYQLFRAWTIDSFRSPSSGEWTPTRRALSLYRQWFAPGGSVPAGYVDTHCWAFIPASFELIVRDLVAFGLVDLRLESVAESEASEIEFYVDLAKPSVPAAVDEDDYYRTRERLVQRCAREMFAAREVDARRARPEAGHSAKRRRSVPDRIVREMSRVARRLRAANPTAP